MSAELKVSADSVQQTRKHSKLGGSVTSRYFNCAGSVALSEGRANQETIHAAEGSAAHELGEMALRGKGGIRFMDATDWLGERVTVGNHVFVVDESMAEAVQVYVDAVKVRYEPGDIILIEHKFDLSYLHPEMFGSGDCGIYKPSTKTLIVLDYKHGKGHVVDAKGNLQLCFYGLGMLQVPSLKGVAIEKIELVIVQPRASHPDGPVRSWEVDVLDLMDFEEDLRAAAFATEDPNATRQAGTWCAFCPAAGICPEFYAKTLGDAQAEFVDVVPTDLSEEEIARRLDLASWAEDGIRALRREAYMRAAGGAKVPGWKVVAKRAVRKFTGSPSDVADKLVMLFDDLCREDVVEERVKSPAQVEKLLPKALRHELDVLVTKESSGTTLARESDRRAEVQPSALAADEFDPV